MSTTQDKKRILVVDDEQDVRDYLTAILEDAGFDVTTAPDGAEALEKVREQPPDLISLDLVMPRKSGIKFLHELRRNREWSRIPFLIVTGHARDDLGRSDLADIMAGKVMSGPGSYLEKPIQPANFIEAVQRQLKLETEDRPAEQNGAEALRRELEQRLQGADKGQLKRLLSLLEE